MSALVRIWAVMATEFRLAVRNRWVLLATVALVLFSLALAFLGAGPGGERDVDALSLTAASLATLSVYLIPLIALLLSYETIAGEVERNTLALLLATPLSRGELMFGKFLGHLLVLACAVLVGYGVSGIAIAATHEVGAQGMTAWARLMATGILLGAVFIAIGMLVSTVAPRIGTAAALVIGIWLLLVVLYDLALLAGLIVDEGGVFTKVVFPVLVLANPGDAFRLFNLASLEGGAPVSGLDGLATTLPFSLNLALLMLAAWLLAMLAGGFLAVRKLKP